MGDHMTQGSEERVIQVKYAIQYIAKQRFEGDPAYFGFSPAIWTKTILVLKIVVAVFTVHAKLVLVGLRDLTQVFSYHITQFFQVLV